MTDSLPQLYFARMDVDPAELRFFIDWYEDKHGPDLMSAGFYSAHAYHCRIGRPFVMNLYEIDSSEIFYTDEYQGKRTPESDPARPRILAAVSNRSNTVYEQIAAHGIPDGAGSWADGDRTGAVTGPALATWRFGGGDGSDQAARAAFESVAARVSAMDGYRSARLGRQRGRLHPANPSTQPPWTIVVEWSDLESGEAVGGVRDAWKLLGSPTHGTLDRVAYNLGVRVTSLT